MTASPAAARTDVAAVEVAAHATHDGCNRLAGGETGVGRIFHRTDTSIPSTRGN
jgi:hypothetical protein